MAIKLPQGGTPLEDLLLRISWKDEDRLDADKAFTELYKRYNKYVRYICSKFNVNKYTDSEMQEALFNNVFNEVFCKAEKLLDFKKGIEEEEKDRMFRTWLAKSAQWFFNRILTENKREKARCPEFISYDEILEQAERFETDEPFATTERAQLELALALLPEKNRAITFTYLTLEDEQGRIPSDIRNSLAKAYGVLPDSLPAIKRRTIKDLIKKLNPQRVNVLE